MMNEEIPDIQESPSPRCCCKGWMNKYCLRFSSVFFCHIRTDHFMPSANTLQQQLEFSNETGLVWKWAPEQLSAMQMTVVNLSLTGSQFASLLTIGFPFPVRTTSQPHGQPPRRGSSFRVMTTVAWVFAAFAMFVTSLNKRTYSYHANNAGLHMSRSALAWGRFEHVSEIRE